MRILKRAALVLSVLLLLVAGVCIALVVDASGEGESVIERWIGQELRKIVNSHLIPQCDFESLEYRSPRSVVLKGFRLTADDPDRPGSTVDILTAGEVLLELKELPRAGEPLKIESVDFFDVNLRLVESEALDGKLIGFSKLLQDQPDPDAPDLSAVLQISRISLDDAAVEIDTRHPGIAPLRFEEIGGMAGVREGAGNVYAFDLALHQWPMFQVFTTGSIDLDLMRVALEKIEIEAEVGPEIERTLPAPIETWLADHQVAGTLKAGGSAEITFGAWRDATFDGGFVLTEAYLSDGEYQLPVEDLRVHAVMRDRRIEFRKIQALALDGEIRGDAVMLLNQRYDTDVRLGGMNLRLERTLTPSEDDQPPRYAGALTFNVSAVIPLAEQSGGLNLIGQGEADIRDGRITGARVISDVIEFMRSRGDASGREQTAGRDRAEAAFAFRGDHVYIDKLEVEGSWFAMRGRGLYFFEDRLNMNINAGPMQKIQSAFGAVGDVLGSITDGLVAYRVTGPINDPQVGVAPLSGILGAPGERERQPEREPEPQETAPADDPLSTDE